jgi:hypothetical protein
LLARTWKYISAIWILPTITYTFNLLAPSKMDPLVGPHNISLALAIQQASSAGQLEDAKDFLEELLAVRAQTPALDMHGCLEYALCEAARNGHAAVVSYLLGQDIEITRPVLRAERQSLPMFCRLFVTADAISSLSLSLRVLHLYGEYQDSGNPSPYPGFRCEKHF